MENNVIQEINGIRKYLRNRSNQSLELQRILSELYQVEGEEMDSLISPSGTSSIYTTLQSILIKFRKEKKKIILYCGDELYFQTPKTIQELREVKKKNIHKRFYL